MPISGISLYFRRKLNPYNIYNNLLQNSSGWQWANKKNSHFLTQLTIMTALQWLQQDYCRWYLEALPLLDWSRAPTNLLKSIQAMHKLGIPILYNTSIKFIKFNVHLSILNFMFFFLFFLLFYLHYFSLSFFLSFFRSFFLSFFLQCPLKGIESFARWRFQSFGSGSEQTSAIISN